MEYPEDIIRQMSDLAISAVPVTTVDPVNSTTADQFVDDILVNVRDELTRRLTALLLTPGEISRARGGVTPTPAERIQLKTEVLQKATELSDVDKDQRRITTIDFIVRRFADLKPALFANLASQLVRQITPTPVPLAGDQLVTQLEQHRQLGLRMLRGYLGTSDRPNCRRLYASLDLNDYLDVPTGAIVRTLDLRTALNPMGGAVVWVLVGSEIWRGRLGVSRGEVIGHFVGGRSGGSWGRGEDFTMRGEDFTMRGEDFTMRGEDFTMRGEDFTMRG